MAAQAGLSLLWLQTPKTCFLVTRLIYHIYCLLWDQFIPYLMHQSLVTTAPTTGNSRDSYFISQSPAITPALWGQTDGYSPALSPSPQGLTYKEYSLKYFSSGVSILICNSGTKLQLWHFPLCGDDQKTLAQLLPTLPSLFMQQQSVPITPLFDRNWSLNTSPALQGYDKKRYCTTHSPLYPTLPPWGDGGMVTNDWCI